METIYSSEISVDFQRTTHRNIQKIVLLIISQISINIFLFEYIYKQLKIPSIQFLLTIQLMCYDSGSQTVRRGALGRREIFLGRREIFKYFHWNDT
jgi:hypothetical protein